MVSLRFGYCLVWYLQCVSMKRIWIESLNSYLTIQKEQDVYLSGRIRILYLIQIRKHVFHYYLTTGTINFVQEKPVCNIKIKDLRYIILNCLLNNKEC